MSTIPVSEVVRVTPGVLAAGGSALNLSGLILTTNYRVPIGAVQAFGSADAVGEFFGFTSTEKKNADKYFAGFDNSNKKPGRLLFSQYPLAAVEAYLRGGSLAGLTLAQLQAFSGLLEVTIDGVLKSASVNLSGATSFTNAAELIADGLGLVGETVGTFTGSIAGTVLTVASGLTGGPLGSGQVLTGGAIVAGTYIVNQLSGTPGGIGTYTVSDSQTQVSATITAHEPAVQYDSVSGSFFILSPTNGAASTMSFGSGALATDLLLTELGGAVISAGADAATPAAYMSELVVQTRAWASFMLNFNPDTPGDTDERYAFAEWNGVQGQRFVYEAIDDALTPATTVPASNSLADRIIAAGISGTSVNWQQPATAIVNPTEAIDYGSLAAFQMGTTASIDFTQANGRITYKFRKQSGLIPGVTDETTFQNLEANGYNCYGAYADGDDEFTWYANGTITGDFLWKDSYVNQIWLNSSFRNDLVRLLQNSFSIPYNAAGRALIEAGLADTINQGLSFGAYRSGVTLSMSQIANVNARAGKNIADTLTNQGWYLLVGDATPEVRQRRGSPPMTFFYVDGQSVQEFDLASIVLQ